MYLTITYLDDIKILTTREEETRHVNLSIHLTQRKTWLKYFSAFCFVFGKIPVPASPFYFKEVHRFVVKE